MHQSSLRHQMGDAASVNTIATTASLEPLTVTTLRVLGHGRAAEARLVRATKAVQRSDCRRGGDAHAGGDADDASFLCVEKVFHPGLLTRLIYRAAFQAPFAYQSNAEAILACFYRRRVAAAIIRATIPEARVAQPLYVRWDQQTRAMVLASEYIRGRGIVPAPTDRWMVRRGLAALLSRRERIAPAPPEEINELLDLMTRLEMLLIQCGLTGSGWQVCKRAMVSTANLLRSDSGYVVVDLESGIPSVLVPRYVMAGLRMGSLPLFDDLDAERLGKWIGDNRCRLAAVLGPSDLDQLDDDIKRLITHSENWKRSEPAVGRQGWRLLGSDFRRRFKARVLDSWQRREIVDSQTEASFLSGGRFFTSLTFLLGLIPGAIGRCFQRLWANRSYRQHVSSILSDVAYRGEVSREFAAEKSESWRASGRIGPETFHCVSARFIANWLLSKLTPTLLHRLISDPVYRANRRMRMFLFCVSGSFQSELGRLLIRSRIEHWRKSERLSVAEADALHRQLDSPAVDEYVRCFGLQIGLKLLLPVVMSLKIGGAAASVASGNPFYFLFMLMLLPMLRTGVTLWRMIASGHAAADYRDALVVGIVPVVGSLAYPVQMYAKFSDLSLFLLRDFAGRVGCWLPIYGGKDSRTELAAIKSVNVLAEALELWLAVTASTRTSSDEHATQKRPVTAPRRLAISRWDRRAHVQLRLLAEETGLAIELAQSAAPSHRLPAGEGQDLSQDARHVA